jgi:hypothetical protein
MLGTARDQAAPLLGRAEEQSLMTSLLDKAHLPFAGLHQLLRPVRERAAELPPVQRDALDAAFGLAGEVAPEH